MFILLVISILITAIYGVFVIISIFGFYKIIDTQDCNDINDIKVSIVIAARNEEEYIERCINSILNQDFNYNNYEIIVVNDHSEDDTLTILQDLKIGNLKILSLPNGVTSKKEALKLGIENAQFNVISSTDADCILPPNWLKLLVSNINKDVDMLLGPIVFEEKGGLLNAFQQLDMLAIQSFQFGLLAINKPTLNNGANLSFKKEEYQLVGGYDEYETPSGDDVFLLEKFIKQKLTIKGLLNKNFIVETNPMISYSQFFQQRIRWASKSKFYAGKMLKMLSLIILFQNILQIFIYSQVVLSENFTNYYIFLLISKWLIDFILLFLVAAFFNRKKSMLYFIPVQLFYPFYILVVGFASMFLKFEWKGRKY